MFLKGNYILKTSSEGPAPGISPRLLCSSGMILTCAILGSLMRPKRPRQWYWNRHSGICYSTNQGWSCCHTWLSVDFKVIFPLSPSLISPSPWILWGLHTQVLSLRSELLKILCKNSLIWRQVSRSFPNISIQCLARPFNFVCPSVNCRSVIK